MALLKILPGGHGDVMLLKWQYNHRVYHVLIDGGVMKSFKQSVLPEIKLLVEAEKSLDLVVITHVDDDHISGILEMANWIRMENISPNFVNCWWFNSGSLIADTLGINDPDKNMKTIALPNVNETGDSQVSIKQGISLEYFLKGTLNWHAELITCHREPQQIGGACFYFLSPRPEDLYRLSQQWQEAMALEKSNQVSARMRDYGHKVTDLAHLNFPTDKSLFNVSSIAFLWEYENKRILFLADSTPDVYLPALKSHIEARGMTKLPVNLVKLSHHGSKYNFHSELLELIDCEHFVVSTDGSHHGLPDKSVLAKIILHPSREKSKQRTIYFNYDNLLLRSIFRVDGEEFEKDNNILLKFPKPHWNGYPIAIE